MQKNPYQFQFPLIIRMSFILLFLIMTFYLLVEFKFYLTPLILGILFAYLLFPIANFFEQRKVPRILANIISIIIGTSAIYGIGFFIYKQFGVFLHDLPALKEQAAGNINIMISKVETYLGIQTGELKHETALLIQNFFESPAQVFRRAFGATFNTVFTILIMPVYIFFLLYYRDKFKEVLLM
ncbi:MAG: AI-2E family transporter, partial [Chlorobi bacterium]|nr:AI-2E family transporter [Chlorobiota bacterium]